MKITGRVKIKSNVRAERMIKGRNGSFEVFSQDGFVQIGDEVRRIEIELDRNQSPYPIGDYECDTPVDINQYGKPMAPRRLNLRDVKAGRAG